MYLDSMQELQQQKMRTSEREPLLEEAEEEVEEANTEVEKETRKNQEIPLQREVEEVNLENNWLTMTSPH